MSVADTIPPSVVLDTKDATIKDTPDEQITLNGNQDQVVDGAHTNGIPNANETNSVAVEPIVIIADPQPDATATLLPKPSSSDNLQYNTDNNASSTPNQSSVAEPAVVIDNNKQNNEEVVVKEEPPKETPTPAVPESTTAPTEEIVAIEDVRIEENEQPKVIVTETTTDNTQQTSIERTPSSSSINATAPTTTTTTTTLLPSSSSSSNLVPSDSGIQPATNPPLYTRTASNNSSSNSLGGGNSSNNVAGNSNNNIPGGNSEIRTSARNLRNSVLGIDEEEVDEHGVKHRKIRRKERSHSRIVLQHKKNYIGETIFKGHQSWVLMLNIQTGIRNAVGRGHSRSTVTAPKSPLSVDGTPSPASAPKSPIEFLGPNNFDNIADFYASPKVLFFPPEGSSITIPHNTGPFKFKDYCPHAFRFLRHRFGIDTADYMVSLCNTQKNGENALRELPTPGKSGSLFFFSHDMRFILKTIPKSEAKLLRSLLPSYVDHIANDENTLLPKFFGLHRVKPHRGRQVRFLVMSNIFQTRKTIHERYDLKGSTLGRAASEEEKKKSTVTYKDLDFRQKNIKIQIGPDKSTALMEQLLRDVKFLAKLNIMDYSLLVGVHNAEKDDEYTSAPPSPQSSRPSMAKPNSQDLSHEYFQSIFQENDGGLRARDENGISTGKIYYMGIIDILMLYSIRKKFEHTYKTLRYGKEEEISSISPNDYATRFYEFVAASIT